LRAHATFDCWLVKPHAKEIADQIRPFDNLILLDLFRSLNPMRIGAGPRFGWWRSYVCTSSFISNQARDVAFGNQPALARDEAAAEKAPH
jgi:hypothetical protein